LLDDAKATVSTASNACLSRRFSARRTFSLRRGNESAEANSYEKERRYLVAPLLPKTSADLEELEGEIQTTAKRLSATTGIAATSLETLVDQLERFGCGASHSLVEFRKWQY
jgi:hypothetical protein